MTITEAWTVVLDYYRDALPPDLQWRPGMKCETPLANGWTTSREELCDVCGAVCLPEDFPTHDIPQPPLTDAAAMAVLRILWRDGRTLDRSGAVWIISRSFTCRGGILRPHIHPDPRDAIILAAAELAHKERAK